jgi:hypothetical protein
MLLLSLALLPARGFADVAPEEMARIRAAAQFFPGDAAGIVFTSLSTVELKGPKFLLRGRGSVRFSNGYDGAAPWQLSMGVDSDDMTLLVDAVGPLRSDVIRSPIEQEALPDNAWRRSTQGLRQCRDLALKIRADSEAIHELYINNPHDYVTQELTIGRGTSGLRILVKLRKVSAHNRADGLTCDASVNMKIDLGEPGAALFLPALAAAELAADLAPPKDPSVLLDGEGSAHLYDPKHPARTMKGAAARVALRFDAGANSTSSPLEPCASVLRRARLRRSGATLRVREPLGFETESATFRYAPGRGPESASPGIEVLLRMRRSPSGPGTLSCEILSPAR